MRAKTPEFSPSALGAPIYAHAQTAAGISSFPVAQAPGGMVIQQPAVARHKVRSGRREMLLLQIVMVGFAMFGKSFATLGVGPLMVAEPLLAYYFLRERGKVITNLLSQLVSLRFLAWIVVAVFLWGIIDVIRPVLAQHDAISALRTSAFDYYPLFIFAGIAIGQKMSFDMLIRFSKTFLWCYLLYTIVFYAYGISAEIYVPWNGSWPLFMQPMNAPFAPLLVLCLWPVLKKWRFRWIALPGALFPMLESTGRGAFLGFGIGLAAVACASRRHRALVIWFLTATITFLTLVGPLIPSDGSHSQNLDPIIQVARIVATVNTDAAYNMLEKRGYHQAATEIWIANGTAEWRKTIWRNCMASLNTPSLLLMGQGHGAPLVNYIPDGQNISTPHNFMIYAIFYTGEIGLGLFLLLLLVMLIEARRIRDPNVWAIYVSNIVMTAMVAAVGNALETPMVSVPFYLISGICLGLKVLPRHAAPLMHQPHRYLNPAPAAYPPAYMVPA